MYIIIGTYIYIPACYYTRRTILLLLLLKCITWNCLYNVPPVRCGRRGKTDRRLRLGGRGVSYLPTGYRYIYNADSSRPMCDSYCRPSDSKKKTVSYNNIIAAPHYNIIILFVFIISLDYDFHRSPTSCCWR